uniref:Membrane protein, putative n=1 Tax=Babesia bovis TaxID=5865 RepID=S6BG35_BABBO|nr:membrane protein, putative [Babesia bovis]
MLSVEMTSVLRAKTNFHQTIVCLFRCFSCTLGCPGKVCACGKSDIAQAEGCGLEKSASFMEVEAPIVIISDSLDKEATESNEGASPTAGRCIPREIQSPDVRYNRLVKSIPGSLRPRVLKYPTIEALPGYLVDLISYHFVQKRYERLLPVLPKSIIKDIMPYSRMCQIPRDLFNELSTYIIKKIDFDLGYDPALIAARYERLRYQLPESLARQIPEDGEIALHDALAYAVVRFLIKGIVKVFPDLYTDRSLTAFAGNPEAPFKRRIFFYSDMLLIGKTMERYSLKTYSDDEPRRIF